jgi:hypothetical protein
MSDENIVRFYLPADFNISRTNNVLQKLSGGFTCFNNNTITGKPASEGNDLPEQHKNCAK